MTDATYDAFARRILASGIINDPWNAGAPRFREAPVFVTRADALALARAAEAVGELHEEVCRLVSDTPDLLESFFGLTPWQRAMWVASEPLWHGIARADVFFTDEGLKVAELNADTPTGEAEAVLLSELAAQDHPGAIDPNQGLADRFFAMARLYEDRLLAGPPARRAVGLVYPTELTDDLSVIRLYRRWFEERDVEVILGSPYNLGRDARGLTLFERPFSLLLRHYKTDWWGERQSAWDDEPIADVEPLEVPLRLALTASMEGQAAVVNPFGAVLPQNKRCFAFFWEHLHRFSPGAQASIERYVPITSRLEALPRERLLHEREDWVLKSDYGAEGEEVVVGRRVTEEVWEQSLVHARAGRWIAQRYFAAREDAEGQTCNLGVYLVAGEAAGLYARLSKGPTDDKALSAPVLLRG